MNTRKKRMPIFLLFILGMIVCGMCFPTWTPTIKGRDSVSELTKIEINGTIHTVMMRGQDKDNPIILFVHGGPGCSEIPYIARYQELLEKSYTVVHYDQRGSGKSYRFFEDYSALSTDLLTDDLLAITEYLSERFDQKKVLLIGHSFGTYIGMKAAAKSPDKFAAYIGIGQMADTRESEMDSLAFCIEQAGAARNNQDIAQLNKLKNQIETGSMLTPRKYIRKYGGAARKINEKMDYALGFFVYPEYNWLDMIRFFRGVSVSQDLLLAESNENDISSIIKKINIPCYFAMGRYDYMTSVHVAREYYNVVDAPKKDFVVFEHSAHYPHLAEKEEFSKWLNTVWDELTE